MNVRNVLSQGYPFIQAIKAALPICDEFVISDGDSDDGTYEELQKLEKRYSKIHLARIPWRFKKANTKFGEVIAETANKTRKLCEGEYLFYIQANEIVHEKSIDSIRRLPKMFPFTEIFHLPFILLMRDAVIEYQFRARLFKNIPEIAVVKDAAQVSYTYRVMIKRLAYILFTFQSNMKIYDMFTRGGMDSVLFQHVTLPMPIFRYASLSAKEYIKKLEQHKILFRSMSKNFDNGISYLKRYGFNDKYIQSVLKNKKSGYVSNKIIRIHNQQPKIMKKVLFGGRR